MENIVIRLQTQDLLAKIIIGNNSNISPDSVNIEDRVNMKSTSEVEDLFLQALGYDELYYNNYIQKFDHYLMNINHPVQHNISCAIERNRLHLVIEEAVHPYYFIDYPNPEDFLSKLIEKLNKYLWHDHLKLEYQKNENKYKLFRIDQTKLVILEDCSESYEEYRNNCYNELKAENVKGALREAYNLLEYTFKFIINTLSPEPKKPNSTKLKLIPLKNKTMELLNIDATQIKNKDIVEEYGKLISNLSSIVHSINHLRNQESDSHSQIDEEINIPKHHATLTVNSAITLAEFLYSSLEYSKNLKS